MKFMSQSQYTIIETVRQLEIYCVTFFDVLV